MIKIRIEGKGFEIARIVDLLVIAFREDVEVTGIYELDRNKSRAYVDIDSRVVHL
jgi:hypothetical protein